MAEVEIVKLIKVVSLEGRGTEEHPFRHVTEYFDMNGRRLWREDPIQEEEKEE